MNATNDTIERAALAVEAAKVAMGAARNRWWDATRPGAINQDAARDAVLALSRAGQRVTAAVAVLDALRAAEGGR
ncbi:MAG: hypothetical protein HOO96_29490 [Polyangiaceae bacterium]|nr:hypothetical protein [Polyangiaceae bacterium]